MDRTSVLALLLLLAATLAGCNADSPDEDSDYDAACEDPPRLEPGTSYAAVFKTSMGDIRTDLLLEQTPITVENFVCLAREGYYDGTIFHRVITDFMMQGGDRSYNDDDASNDEQGPPFYTIPDEFHHAFKLDHKGVLAMANSGPDTGANQFFITFAPTTWLNDHHTVFGEVSEGMETLDRVNSEAASSTGKPTQEVRLESVEIETSPAPARTAALSLWTPDGHHLVEEGGATQFLMVVQNDGNQRTNVTITATPATGATATIEEEFRQFELPAGQRAAFVIEAEAGAAASGTLPITISASTEGATISQAVQIEVSDDVGPDAVARTDSPRLNYIGLTTDGRVFDTSVESVGEYAKDNNLGFYQFKGRASYAPISIPVTNYVPGFTDLAVGTLELGKAAGRLPVDQAYGPGSCPSNNRDCFKGRVLLLFQLEVVAIE
jgi:cyclophilin family peptidyl-prolyl cis-trans isomerase